MKSIIWKELRENALWASIAAILVLLGEAFALRASDHQWTDMTFAGPGLRSGPDQIYSYYVYFMAAFCPLIAFALGLLQTAPELRRDQWALLIHRPLSTRDIWRAKSVVGLGLYLAATLAPLILVTAWLMSPGHFPGPFGLILIVPCLIGIVSGVSAYFAAQLVALRTARWWGSRLVPVVTVIVTCTGAALAREPFEALVIALFAAVSIGAAALGAFNTRGEYSGQTRWQRLGLGITMLVGVSAVGFALGAVALSWVPRGGVSWTRLEYAMDTKGKIVQVLNDNGNITLVLDQNGQPVRNRKPNADYRTFGWSALQLGNPPYYTDALPPFSAYAHWYDELTSTEHQEYFFDRGERVFMVYSLDTGIPEGYLGTAGTLAPNVGAAGPLPSGFVISTPNDDESGNLLFLAGSRIYRLNISAARLSVFAAAPAGTAFHSLLRAGEDQNSDAAGFVLAASDNKIYAYDNVGRQVAAVPVHAKPAVSTLVNVIAERDPLPHFYFLVNGGWAPASAKSAALPWRLVEAVAPGKVVRETALPEPQAYLNSSIPDDSYPSYIGVPLGAPLVIASVIGLASLVDPSIGHGFLSSFFSDQNLPVFGLMGLGGLLCSLLMFPIARRYGWTWQTTALWMLATLFLSWAGLLMVLAMIPRPRQVSCPHCGRKRIVSNEFCEHCGAPFPAPAPDGREMFEPAEVTHWQESVLTT